MNFRTRALLAAGFGAVALGLSAPTAFGQYAPESTSSSTTSTTSATTSTVPEPDQDIEEQVTNAEPEQVQEGETTTVSFDSDLPPGETGQASFQRARPNSSNLVVDDITVGPNGQISYSLTIPEGTEPGVYFIVFTIGDVQYVAVVVVTDGGEAAAAAAPAPSPVDEATGAVQSAVDTVLDVVPLQPEFSALLLTEEQEKDIVAAVEDGASIEIAGGQIAAVGGDSSGTQAPALAAVSAAGLAAIGLVAYRARRARTA